MNNTSKTVLESIRMAILDPNQQFRLAFSCDNYEEMRKLFNYNKLSKDEVAFCFTVAIKGNESKMIQFLWQEYINTDRHVFEAKSACDGSWIFAYLTPYLMTKLLPHIHREELQ